MATSSGDLNCWIATCCPGIADDAPPVSRDEFP